MYDYRKVDINPYYNKLSYKKPFFSVTRHVVDRARERYMLYLPKDCLWNDVKIRSYLIYVVANKIKQYRLLPNNGIEVYMNDGLFNCYGVIRPYRNQKPNHWDLITIYKPSIDKLSGHYRDLSTKKMETFSYKFFEVWEQEGLISEV